MASGTTGFALTSTYQLISGAETYIAGLVMGRYPAELWYGPTGTQGTNGGLSLAPGQDFSYTMGAGDGLYARSLTGDSFIEIQRRVS